MPYAGLPDAAGCADLIAYVLIVMSLYKYLIIRDIFITIYSMRAPDCFTTSLSRL